MPAVDDLLSLAPLELFDQFAAGVFVTDALGDVLAVNRTAADMLGYSQEELVGRNIATFTHPEDVVGRRRAGRAPPRAGSSGSACACGTRTAGTA